MAALEATMLNCIRFYVVLPCPTSSKLFLRISVDDHFGERDSYEADAKRTIMLVASVFFENPWV